MGVVIPPSVPMIIYAVIAQQSVSSLVLERLFTGAGDGYSAHDHCNYPGV
nr:hypothetical protein [Halomonas lionensis]